MLGLCSRVGDALGYQHLLDGVGQRRAEWEYAERAVFSYRSTHVVDEVLACVHAMDGDGLPGSGRVLRHAVTHAARGVGERRLVEVFSREGPGLGQAPCERRVRWIWAVSSLERASCPSCARSRGT